MDWWTKSKWAAKQPGGASKKNPAIVLEALSGKPVPTGKAAATNAPAAAPVAPDDKDAATSFYKAMLRLLRRPEGVPGASGNGAGTAQVTATEKLTTSWLKKCNQAGVVDADIAALLSGQDSLKDEPTMGDVDAWIGKIEKRLGAVADVADWNTLVDLVGTPILLRAVKTRRASTAAAVSAEDVPPSSRSTRSGSCKPFPSLLSVGIVITSFNRDEWDAVVPAMENARFFASEARAMMARGELDAAEAGAHYEEYKGHMNTLKQLQKRALPGLDALLAEPEPETALGKRQHGEIGGGADDDEEEEEEEEEEKKDAAAAEKGEEEA